ncbi:MAG: hypothetical protein J6M17_11945 [Ruminococcus sp.]|nr:hypothetical protein [Ruminococcus sp.]
MKYCRKCGEPLADNAVICVKCNTEVTDSPIKKYDSTYVDLDEDPVNGLLIIISIVFAPIGLLISALNLNNGRKRSGTVYFICSILPFIFTVVLFISQFGLLYQWLN